MRAEDDTITSDGRGDACALLTIARTIDSISTVFGDASGEDLLPWRISGLEELGALFSRPRGEIEPGRLRFAPVRSIEMERSVPEESWKVQDPNADRLKANEPGLF